MIRGWVAAMGAMVVLFGASAPALAWSNGIDGAPSIGQNSPTGYYIWHDGGFHVRTHGPGERHSFVARLHTDGVFQNVDTVRLESKDGVQVTDGGHTLVARFETFDAMDGVNFTIDGGDKLRFALELDGQSIGTQRIFLGSGGGHPAGNPFTVCR